MYRTYAHHINHIRLFMFKVIS